VQQFRAWLQRHVDEIRGLLTPSGLEARFSGMNIFGPDDDRDFNPNQC
jgi:hypothetical protein